MKVKTEAKRESILNEAAQVFREQGFEGASMSAICARVGGSKATLYNYFSSKEELFFEIVNRSCEAEFDAAHQFLDQSSGDIAKDLQNFGERFLEFLYSADVQGSRRMAISAAGKSELGRLMYERGVLRSQRLVADFLRSAMRQGNLRDADPVLATKQLYALLEAELIDSFHFQLDGDIGKQKIAEATTRALAVFLAAYGPRV